MNTLPQYFYIKRSDDSRWKEYIKWLSEKYKYPLDGFAVGYYGYDGNMNYNGKTGINCTHNSGEFLNSATEITLDQWEQAIKEVQEPKAGDLILCRTEGSRFCERIFLRFEGEKAVFISAYKKELYKDGEGYEEVVANDWKPLEKPKLPVLHGYAGELKENSVKYGCAELSFDDIRALAKTPKGITLSYEGCTIKMHDLEKVLKVINQK